MVVGNAAGTAIAGDRAGSPAELRRVISASVIGTIIEWYDFLIYGTAAALVFSKLFFPTTDARIGIVSAFSVYAVGYLARPLGGLVFGHFGDRLGRKTMLMLSMVIMGGGTFLVGCLPTYQEIGIAAPILLVALRLVQGLGLGGEWGGAVLMVAESAPLGRRGILGSLVQLGNPIGRFIATGIFALTVYAFSGAFLAWAWRIPFLASIVLVGIGLFIRYRLHETPAFVQMREARQQARVPLLEVLAKHRRAMFISIGLKTCEVAWTGVFAIFAQSYLTNHLHLPRQLALDGVFLAAALEILIMPLAGSLSDRIGRRPVFMAGILFCLIAAFPMFWLLDTKSPALILAALMIGISFGQGIMFSLHASFMPELFGTNVRYSGVSIGFQVGAAVFGGLTPLIAAISVNFFAGATWPISTYLVVLALVSLFAVAKARESTKASLAG
jgi:MFS transporter, MHS family, shikimate and dehydroshikimate transport protein